MHFDRRIPKMLEGIPFINFKTPANIEMCTSSQSTEEMKCKFAIGSSNVKLVSLLLLYNGIFPTKDNDFSLLWSTPSESESITPKYSFQRINHFPYSKQIIGNKAQLSYIIQSHPNYLDFPPFYPITYILPKDHDLLYKRMKSSPRTEFIEKPPDGSCGRGIKIVTFNDFYLLHRTSVVSEYISRPLTIDSFKFDLRIYALVTSYSPLRAFVYQEGLCRFATELYRVGKSNIYSQLTNSTLNKHSPNYNDNFKWKLTDLLIELEHRYQISQTLIRNKINRVVSQAIALIQPIMTPKYRNYIYCPYFELYGFDLLLDHSLNVWLLEINTNPSMSYNESVDFDVKVPLLINTLNIVGIPNLYFNDLLNISQFVDPKNIEEIDNDIVRAEDLRNLNAGNGFIRIFPSIENSDLEKLLKKAPCKPQKRRRYSPEKVARLFTKAQAIELLLKYIIEICNGDEDNQLDKVKRFVRAQGFKGSIKEFLRYMRRRNEGEDVELPKEMEKAILKSSKMNIKRLFMNCNLAGVQRVEMLFE